MQLQSLWSVERVHAISHGAAEPWSCRKKALSVETITGVIEVGLRTFSQDIRSKGTDLFMHGGTFKRKEHVYMAIGCDYICQCVCVHSDMQDMLVLCSSYGTLSSSVDASGNSVDASVQV